MDKAGHMFTSYMLGSVGHQLLNYACTNDKNQFYWRQCWINIFDNC